MRYLLLAVFGIFAVLGMVLLLPGCGDSCSSLQKEMIELTRGMAENPQQAMKDGAVKKMQELGIKLREKGCKVKLG